MKYERPTKTISRESFPRRRCCFLSQQQIKGKAVGSNTNSSVETQRAKKKGPVLANEASEDSGNPNELDKMLRQQLYCRPIKIPPPGEKSYSGTVGAISAYGKTLGHSMSLGGLSLPVSPT